MRILCEAPWGLDKTLRCEFIPFPTVLLLSKPKQSHLKFLLHFLVVRGDNRDITLHLPNLFIDFFLIIHSSMLHSMRGHKSTLLNSENLTHSVVQRFCYYFKWQEVLHTSEDPISWSVRKRKIPKRFTKYTWKRTSPPGNIPVYTAKKKARYSQNKSTLFE